MVSDWQHWRCTLKFSMSAAVLHRNIKILQCPTSCSLIKQSNFLRNWIDSNCFVKWIESLIGMHWFLRTGNAKSKVHYTKYPVKTTTNMISHRKMMKPFCTCWVWADRGEMDVQTHQRALLIVLFHQTTPKQPVNNFSTKSKVKHKHLCVQQSSVCMFVHWRWLTRQTNCKNSKASENVSFNIPLEI